MTLNIFNKDFFVIKQFMFKIFSPLSLSLIFIGFFASIVLFFVESRIFKDYELYDYDSIQKNGEIVNATIKKITSRDNVSVNGINPKIITYEYLIDNKVFIDNFQSIEVNKINTLSNRDSIKIYTYKDESVIKDMLPYRISLKLFWILPIGTIFIGIVLLILSKIYRKNGVNSLNSS